MKERINAARVRMIREHVWRFSIPCFISNDKNASRILVIWDFSRITEYLVFIFKPRLLPLLLRCLPFSIAESLFFFIWTLTSAFAQRHKNNTPPKSHRNEKFRNENKNRPNMASSTIPLGEYLFRRIKSLGIEHVLGCPGDFNREPDCFRCHCHTY